MAQWLAAIIALPKILELAFKLIWYFQDKFGADWDKKIDELHAATKDLEGAQTDDERFKALRAMLNSTKLK